MHIYCPLCECTPEPGHLWVCECGHEWDTFATRGVCPACERVYTETDCPSCYGSPPHEAWYHEDPLPPFIHSCGNCAKPVRRDAFPQPNRGRGTVLRYFTHDKFRLFLRDSAFYMARLDTFEDPYEGSLPRSAQARIAAGKRGNLYEHEEDRRLWTKQFYVSCWHLASDESDAMWRLYCGRDGGVCVVSSFGRLARLKSGTQLHLGLVTYIDYRTQTFAWWDDFAPMMHKRKAFEHEREVRLVAGLGACNFLLSSREQAVAHLQRQPKGYRLPCDLNKVVVRVLVSPYASEDRFNEVVELARSASAELAARVQWSHMRPAPSF